MSISLEEVRHIASLARLGITDDRARIVAGELNSILAHMQVLTAVQTDDPSGAHIWSTSKMLLRADDGPPIALARAPDHFAPAMREGFFLVPRLATHEDADV